ncbi:MAG TPA: 2-hydroxyacid dehydrogenase [Streptosporangiaceae bacterium]|nr:2-hydroxyacid dehydrogenase [Streptosporangiaceae bacterium]
MRSSRLVAVCNQVDDDYVKINTEVLGADAKVEFVQRLPEAARPGLIASAEVLIGWNPLREAGPLSGAPALRFIQLLSAGADAIDFSAIPDQVTLAGNLGAFAAPIAEHVLAMTLALARRLPQRHASLAEGQWNQRERLITLDGAVCAILGYGGIGAATARLMRAFGARIYAVNTSGRTDDDVEFAGTLADLDQVLAAADVLVISLPMTKATRGLIGARELALMKPQAIIVNVARGAIIDEHALYEHLARNRCFGAGIDAWWHEPRPDAGFSTSYPFFSLPNFIGSPHNSGIAPGTLARASRKAAENALRYLRGEPVTGVMRREDYL